jgi:hypothetical protein
VVVQFFLESIYQGERPVLPMNDLPLTKGNALSFDLWGLLYQNWKPTPEEGVTVFLRGLEKRGLSELLRSPEGSTECSGLRVSVSPLADG